MTVPRAHFGSFGVALATALGLGASPCWAGDAEAATALGRDGVEHFRRQEYEAARAAFERAYELEPTADTLLDLGLAELNAGKPVQAAGHLRAYVTWTRDDEPREKVEAVRTRWLPRAESQIARLHVVAPTGAEILVDGQRAVLDATLGIVEVLPGDHDVTARARGQEEAQHLTALRGETLTVTLLADAPAAPPSVLPEPQVPAAAETDADGLDASTLAAAIALTSGALVAAGLGVGFALASRSDEAAANGLRSQIGSGGCFGTSRAAQCAALQLAAGVQSRDAWISVGSYIGAGVLAGAGVATWWLWPSLAPLRAAPAFGPGYAALMLDGKW
jgi:hypothetical protein